MLTTQLARCESFAMLNHFACCHTWRYSHEQMYVVRIDCEFQDLPTFFVALALNETTTILSYAALKNRLTSLWSPDQMIDNQMHSVLVSLVFHLRLPSMLIE